MGDHGGLRERAEFSPPSDDIDELRETVALLNQVTRGDQGHDKETKENNDD